MTDPALASQLRKSIAWGTPERRWPQWTYIKRVGEQGRELAQAIESGNLLIVAQLIPGVANALVAPELT